MQPFVTTSSQESGSKSLKCVLSDSGSIAQLALSIVYTHDLTSVGQSQSFYVTHGLTATATPFPRGGDQA